MGIKVTMTINKSQGQLLKQLKVYLSTPILIINKDGINDNNTSNVVYFRF